MVHKLRWQAGWGGEEHRVPLPAAAVHRAEADDGEAQHGAHRSQLLRPERRQCGQVNSVFGRLLSNIQSLETLN